MTPFIFSTTVLLILAWLFVLPALWRTNATAQTDQTLNLHVFRDQLRELERDRDNGAIDAQAYQSARQDIERRVVEEGSSKQAVPINTPRQAKLTAAIALAIPLFAIALYAKLGTPSALLDSAQEVSADIGAEQIQGMVARLAEKLKTHPDDADGWRMLARSYDTLQRHDAAVDAYRHLLALEPNDPDALTDFAVTLAMSLKQESLTGEPEQLIARALKVDPNHIQALALSGNSAFERGDYARAIVPWQRILTLIPADSDVAHTIEASIAHAQTLAARKKAGPAR